MVGQPNLTKISRWFAQMPATAFQLHSPETSAERCKPLDFITQHDHKSHHTKMYHCYFILEKMLTGTAGRISPLPPNHMTIGQHKREAGI